MTTDDFLYVYPQFERVGQYVTNIYVNQANARFDEFEDDAEEARRLYVAHKLTMYARTYAEIPDQASDKVMMSKLTDAGGSAQALSKSVGGVSISRSETSGTSSISGWSEWKQTTFGLQLITLAKAYMCGGRYVP